MVSKLFPSKSPYLWLSCFGFSSQVVRYLPVQHLMHPKEIWLHTSTPSHGSERD